MKKPFPALSSTALTISASRPAAASGVIRPSTTPAPPTSSVPATTHARIAGLRKPNPASVLVSAPIPEPPHIPNTCCIPWAKNTPPTAKRSSSRPRSVPPFHVSSRRRGRSSGSVFAPPSPRRASRSRNRAPGPSRTARSASLIVLPRCARRRRRASVDGALARSLITGVSLVPVVDQVGRLSPRATAATCSATIAYGAPLRPARCRRRAGSAAGPGRPQRVAGGQRLGLGDVHAARNRPAGAPR